MIEPNLEPLGADARALLDAAREGLAPDAAAIRRMRANVAASVGAGAGVALGVKLALVAAVVAVGAGTWLAVTRDAKPQAARVDSAQIAPASARIAQPAQVEAASAQGASAHVDSAQAASAQAASAQAASAQAASAQGASVQAASAQAASARVASAQAASAPAASGQVASAQRKSPPARVAAAPVAAPARVRSNPPASNEAPRRAAQAEPAVEAGGSNLAREVELLDLAMTSLRTHDPKVALAAVRRHAAETAGNGQLAEDAAAIEVEALCQLHDPATAGKLAAFEARYPRSAQRSRLSTQCP